MEGGQTHWTCWGDSTGTWAGQLWRLTICSELDTEQAWQRFAAVMSYAAAQVDVTSGLRAVGEFGPASDTVQNELAESAIGSPIDSPGAGSVVGGAAVGSPAAGSVVGGAAVGSPGAGSVVGGAAVGSPGAGSVVGGAASGKGLFAAKWLILGALAGSALTAGLITTHALGPAREEGGRMGSTAVASVGGVAGAAGDPTSDPTSREIHELIAPAEPSLVPAMASGAAAESGAAHGQRAAPPLGTALPSASDGAGLRAKVASELAAEVLHLDSARKLSTAGMHTQLLRSVAAFHRRFPRGALAPEAEVLALESLVELGRRAAASRRAKHFLSRYPVDPHSQRVRVWVQK